MIKTHCSFCNKPITIKTVQYTGNDICKQCKDVLSNENEIVVIAGNTEVYHN